VLRDSPHSAPALLLEARLLQSERRLDEALRVAHRAVAANPNQPEALLVEGDILAARGDEAEADRAFERAATLSPGDPRPYLAQAKYRLARGRTLESESFVRRLVKLSPSGPGATLLGLLLEEQNHPADAERAFEQVLAANPSDGIAANNLAWLYQQEGRLDEALRWATVAHARLRSGEANDTLGWVHVRRGEYREALPMLLGAIRAKPANPLYHYHLAVAYSKSGSPVQARDEVQRALASDLTFSGRDDATRLRTALDGAAAGTPH
jgi:Flp pilus assembly protein TadD